MRSVVYLDLIKMCSEKLSIFVVTGLLSSSLRFFNGKLKNLIFPITKSGLFF